MQHEISGVVQWPGLGLRIVEASCKPFKFLDYLFKNRM